MGDQPKNYTNAYGEYSCDRCGKIFLPLTTAEGVVVEVVCEGCESEEDDLSEHLREYVELFVEKKVREADVSDGSRVQHGSLKHVKDLEARIADLVKWRDKQRKGTEARANYARLISRLKSELASAKRASEKWKMRK